MYINKLLIGGKYVLEGGDLFGNQSASDMIIYLKEICSCKKLYAKEIRSSWEKEKKEKNGDT